VGREFFITLILLPEGGGIEWIADQYIKEK